MNFLDYELYKNYILILDYELYKKLYIILMEYWVESNTKYLRSINEARNPIVTVSVKPKNGYQMYETE